jgi:anti-sigma factor RsiW
MDHKEAKENMLVDRYLAGQLGARERRRFEQHYLGCEACVEELELTERLRGGLHDVVFADRPAAPVEMKQPAAPSNAPRYAMAASVVLAASLVAAGLAYDGERDGITAAGAEMFPIHSTRSVSDISSLVRLSSPETSAVLLVDPGREIKHDYRITLQRLEGAETPTVAQVAGVQPSYEALVAITVPGTLLEPGVHMIVLEGREDEAAAYAAVTELRFRVERD